MLSPSLHKILIKHINYYGNNDLTSSIAIGILQTLHSRVQFYLETVNIKAAPKRSALRLQENLKKSHKVNCILCSSDHALFLCPEYKEMSVQDRWSKVKSHHLFFNCLSKGHSVRNCSSKGRCKKCNSSHHSLLHKELVSTNNLPSSSSASSTSSELSVAIVRQLTRIINVPRILMTALALATSGTYE